MATIYAEAVLAQKTRVKNEDGQYLGGPVYYIRTAFQGSLGKFLAAFFAIAIILALGFTGCMVQSNSIGSTFSTAFGVPSWIRWYHFSSSMWIYFRWRRSASCFRYGEAGSHHGSCIPSGRRCCPDRKDPVCSGNFWDDLQICLPAPGHRRRCFWYCIKGSHQPGCKARPVLQ